MLYKSPRSGGGYLRITSIVFKNHIHPSSQEPATIINIPRQQLNGLLCFNAHNHKVTCQGPNKADFYRIRRPCSLRKKEETNEQKAYFFHIFSQLNILILKNNRIDA